MLIIMQNSVPTTCMCTLCVHCAYCCSMAQDQASAIPDSGLLERVSKIMGYIKQTSGGGPQHQQYSIRSISTICNSNSICTGAAGS